MKGTVARKFSDPSVVDRRYLVKGKEREEKKKTRNVHFFRTWRFLLSPREIVCVLKSCIYFILSCLWKTCFVFWKKTKRLRSALHRWSWNHVFGVVSRTLRQLFVCDLVPFFPTLIITEDFGVCDFKLFVRPEVILYAADTALKPRKQPWP